MRTDLRARIRSHLHRRAEVLQGSQDAPARLSNRARGHPPVEPSHRRHRVPTIQTHQRMRMARQADRGVLHQRRRQAGQHVLGGVAQRGRLHPQVLHPDRSGDLAQTRPHVQRFALARARAVHERHPRHRTTVHRARDPRSHPVPRDGRKVSHAQQRGPALLRRQFIEGCSRRATCCRWRCVTLPFRWRGRLRGRRIRLRGRRSHPRGRRGRLRGRRGRLRGRRGRLRGRRGRAYSS